PLGAIQIIGLPEELEEDLVHQYGQNSFRLFRLPVPRENEVVGILGGNGIGKTTAIRILGGEMVPNMGRWEEEATWDVALDAFSGTELHNHLRKIADKGVRASIKPQYVDSIPQAFKGHVRTLLEKVDDNGRLDEMAEELELTNVLKENLGKLSGGELQRVALAASMLKDADIYFFDEPSSYLDIYQRLKMARVIRTLAEKKKVVVIEHDLAVLDFLADTAYMLYGSEGAYGVVAHPRGVRQAINTYLSGMMREENIRFRDYSIEFDPHPPRQTWRSAPLIEFDALEKNFERFHLRTGKGTIHEGEVVGILGPNATGKTTFVKLLAGVEAVDSGKVEKDVRISYKPQYIKPTFDGSVRDLFYTTGGQQVDTGFFKTEVDHPLNLRPLMDSDVQSLSGGELQRVAIANCLLREADIYLIDEPSAYLDSIQRMNAAKTLRRVMEKSGKSAMVVDHDVYFIDLVSDTIMVFGGEPGVEGMGEGPFKMRDGMNRFLEQVGVTFRRDLDSGRPRINKPESKLDREQKGDGEYYYAGI
ncbi:MAG: ribosome biogenesis/translation initiation ATPase RLI, partial [Thermoplasmata archaeon]|nr:ribosome biogenesis/translation initiation ATPase RLI [Thermoplasmata archaeon]